MQRNPSSYWSQLKKINKQNLFSKKESYDVYRCKRIKCQIHDKINCLFF